MVLSMVGEAEGIGAIFRVRIVRHAFHPVEVGARAERRAVRGEHDHAYRGVVGQGAKRGGQFDDGGVVEGVAHVRAIERDARHVAIGGDGQAL